MKSKWPLVSMFVALCILVISCSKKDAPDDDVKHPVIDSSKCLLTKVNYVPQPGMPYTYDPISLTYDNMKRIASRITYGFVFQYSYQPDKIIERKYLGTVADSNLANNTVYILDNNSRVVYHMSYTYDKPISDDDYIYKDSTTYQYNSEGYLTGKKLYSHSLLVQESKFTYLNGNLAQREKVYYEASRDAPIKRGADTLTYTYDNQPFYPESAYLYEVQDLPNIRIGTPNKNNVIGIQCKMYDPSGTNLLPHYTNIQYAYVTTGPKLVRVNMTATTTKDPINTYVGFEYWCE